MNCITRSFVLLSTLFITVVPTICAQEATESETPVASISVSRPEYNSIATKSLVEEKQAQASNVYNREWFESRGVTSSFTYRGELFTNMRGGMDSRRGAEYLGSADTTLTLDLGKMKIARGQMVVSAQSLHGRSINDRKVGAVQAVSNLDNAGFSKLVEVYYGDSFFGDRLKFKIGRQYVDADFNAIDNGGGFINSSYGLIPTVPMPTYPHPDFGGSVFASPAKWVSVGVGVFKGEALDPMVDGGKTIDKGVFTITEAQFKPLRATSAMHGTYRVGFWNQNDGAYLTATPTSVVRNYGVFATGDHWFRPATSAGENVGPGVFFQLGWSPGDRNEITRYYGGGLAWPGLIPVRSRDSIGVGVTRAKLSGISTSETVTEFFYKLQIVKQLYIQPDIQYVHKPSGAGNNALLGGLRLGIEF